MASSQSVALLAPSAPSAQIRVQTSLLLKAVRLSDRFIVMRNLVRSVKEGKMWETSQRVYKDLLTTKAPRHEGNSTKTFKLDDDNYFNCNLKPLDSSLRLSVFVVNLFSVGTQINQVCCCLLKHHKTQRCFAN
jgi:hypothetical protein